MVGNGWRVLFWKDRWYGNNLLCVLFPSLFALFVSKDVWVKDVWNSFAERVIPHPPIVLLFLSIYSCVVSYQKNSSAEREGEG